MGKIQLVHTYDDIISVENLLLAWREFALGKRNRKDVQEFEAQLMDSILVLHRDLKTGRYKHSPYEFFKISDPKSRDIHKASVRDRLLHHALCRILSPFFERTFIADSYSCRVGKGTHRAMNRFKIFSQKVSRNHTKTCWVLKCDIQKFFASIDHVILLDTMGKYIPDQGVLWLISEIVESFTSTKIGVGLPLGNVTSQLFANVYLNEFDQFVKHTLKAKEYIRYADDFVVFSRDKMWLDGVLLETEYFLEDKLKLTMHPDKVFIRTASSGVDFLGWVHFPMYRVLRTTTKKRMLRRIALKEGKREVVNSYLGLLRHGNTWKIRRGIEEDLFRHLTPNQIN